MQTCYLPKKILALKKKCKETYLFKCLPSGAFCVLLARPFSLVRRGWNWIMVLYAAPPRESPEKGNLRREQSQRAAPRSNPAVYQKFAPQLDRKCDQSRRPFSRCTDFFVLRAPCKVNFGAPLGETARLIRFSIGSRYSSRDQIIMLLLFNSYLNWK